jgi:anaerobic selenocysteine-containing dehydrogenase
MDRRRFLKVTAITGASAALAQCGHPEHQLIRFVPEEELTPGIAVWKPSVCPLCPAACGVVARVMDGDAEVFRDGQAGVTRMALAKKLEGDPAHAVSQGKLCVRGQAALQAVYHPDRVAAPLRRAGDRGRAQFQEITWEASIAEVVTRLDALVAAGQTSSIAFVSRPRRGRRPQLVRDLLRRLGAPPPVTFEVFDDAVLRRANQLSFGHYQLPTFDLARSHYVVSFGADLLGTWNSPVAHSVAYGRMRQQQPGARAKLVAFEPRLSQTGASADEWIAVRPGTEGIAALGLAHVIVRAGLRAANDAGPAGSLIDGWDSGLTAYTPEAVEQRTGVQARRLERIGRELAVHPPAVCVIGGAPLAHTNGLGQAMAVNALNALLGSVRVPGGVSFTPDADAEPAGRPLRDVLASPVPQLLFVDEANPLFAAPPAWRVAEALRQIPFIVSFSPFIDETTAHADLVLPDHAFLESWMESQPESGATAAVSAVTPPAVRPLHQTRSTPDVLLDIARRLKQPLEPPLTVKTYEELLQAPAATSAPAAPARATASRARVAVADPRFDGDAEEYRFHFLPYASQALLDGSLAHLPWLQELPDPLTTGMWCSWVEINARTAEELGIADGDMVEIASAHGAIRAPAISSPGIAPNVVAMPVGQGHETFTRYASGRGANPLAILAPSTDDETGAHAWAATRVRLTRVGDADGSLVLFAGATRERPEHAAGRG